MKSGKRKAQPSSDPASSDGSNRGSGEFQQDILAHLADHLLEMRDLAERGQFGDLSRLLDRAYEEAFVQLRTRTGSFGSVR